MLKRHKMYHIGVSLVNDDFLHPLLVQTDTDFGRAFGLTCLFGGQQQCPECQDGGLGSTPRAPAIFALDEIGRPIPNTVMIGALCAVTGVVDGDHIKKDIDKKLGGKLSEKMIQGNKRAVERAFEEVQGENG